MTTIGSESEAWKLYRAGDLVRAEEIACKELYADPNNASVQFLLGQICRRLGRVNDAVVHYRRFLRLVPDDAEAHYQAGAIFLGMGILNEAARCLERALYLKPDRAGTHNNLGLVLLRQRKSVLALQHFDRMLLLAPEDASGHNNRGIALAALARSDEAVASYQRAVQIKPDYAEAHNNLGLAQAALEKREEAEARFREAISLQPSYAKAHNNLGAVLVKLGKSEDEALSHYREALRLMPTLAEAHNNLAQLLAKQGKLGEAVATYRQAIKLRPDYAEAHNNLGVALLQLGQVQSALASFDLAIRAKPKYAEAPANMAGAYADQGRLDEAIASFRKAVELKPRDAAHHSNLLFALHYHSAITPEAMYAEHLQWAQRHAEPLRRKPHALDLDSSCRLRIGYVSPDFRRHPVATFIEPVLAAHDRDRFEITCYANVSRPDDVTQRLQKYPERWRSLVGLSDEQATELIRDDRIDILVDLAGHTPGNRLLLFARKPAPVQVSYLGYFDTTGMSAIDYRITDSQLDPPGLTEEYHSEELVRLPEIAWCYQPPDSPEVNDLPALRSGHVTFGSLNNPAKVTPDVIALWSRLLAAVPGSRLLFKTDVDPKECRHAEELIRQGVARERLTVIGKIPPGEDYWQLYHQIDIALDPFPYTGATTTCDSLWMGVPVITLAGSTYVSRQSTSLLSHLGLPELIANTPDAYLAIAAGLAADLDKLGSLRTGLRERMVRSTLLNGKRFTSQLEDCYRRMVAARKLEGIVFEGQEHLARLEFEEARPLLERAVAAVPNAAWYRLLLSRALLEDEKEWEKAEEMLRSVLVLQPGQSEAREKLAILLQRQGRSLDHADTDYLTLEDLYRVACTLPSDIHEHCATLFALAKDCRHVTEMGTRTGVSTAAFLYAQPERLVCYDRIRMPQVDRLRHLAGRTQFIFHQADVLQTDVEETDLLFIDTWHVYEQLKEELRRHASKARRYIVLHDTTTYGAVGEAEGHRGIWPALEEFLHEGDFVLQNRYENNNGLTVIRRK